MIIISKWNLSCVKNCSRETLPPPPPPLPLFPLIHRTPQGKCGVFFLSSTREEWFCRELKGKRWRRRRRMRRGIQRGEGLYWQGLSYSALYCSSIYVYETRPRYRINAKITWIPGEFNQRVCATQTEKPKPLPIRLSCASPKVVVSRNSGSSISSVLYHDYI